MNWTKIYVVFLKIQKKTIKKRLTLDKIIQANSNNTFRSKFVATDELLWYLNDEQSVEFQINDSSHKFKKWLASLFI